MRGEAPGGWESAKLSCTGCPVACLRALRRRGRPGTVLSHALLTGLWPELRRRDAASWCEFVLQCADEGVDAGLVAAVLNGSQGPAGRGALTGRAPWNGDGASLRRLISGTASAGVAGATRSMSAGEGEVPEVLAAAGAASRRAAAPAELAQVVGELVGACAQIAGEADAQVRLDGYAQALVAGRGRAASVDGLLRAAGRAVRLERVLAWNVSAAAPLRAVPLSDGAEQGNVAGCGAVVEAGRAH